MNSSSQPLPVVPNSWYERSAAGTAAMPVPGPPRHRTRLRTRHPPLGRRTHHRPAALVPPPAHPLGHPRRHPRSIHEHRLQHHLLPTTHHMTILLGPLRYRDQLKAAHPDAIGGEMEGSGIYAAAMRGKIDWALVKGICDWGHGKSDEYQHVAA